MATKSLLLSFALAAISFAAAPGRNGDQATTFTFKQDGGKQTYTGAVSGSEIKCKREGGQGQPREFNAKKAQ